MTSADFKFELGDEVKDIITGFKGVVISRTQWLNACNVYGVQPRKLKDNKIQEKGHFDEPQLELVKSEVVKPFLKHVQESAGVTKTGGPAEAVSQPNR